MLCIFPASLKGAVDILFPNRTCVISLLPQSTPHSKCNVGVKGDICLDEVRVGRVIETGDGNASNTNDPFSCVRKLKILAAMGGIHRTHCWCLAKRTSLEQQGCQMAANASSRLDMCQTPQQTAEINASHS